MACKAPTLLVSPPRLLPQLSTLDKEESQQRTLYWLPVLAFGPLFMAVICEGMRAAACRTKKQEAIHPEDSGNYKYSPINLMEEEASPPISQSSDAEVLLRDRWPRRFSLALILYHAFCASLVLLALSSGWTTVAGGGSFAWELWAVWQHACLWALFVQSLLRCKRSSLDGLQQPTFKTVLLYTCPFLSEVADTLKDWVVCGICLQVTATGAGCWYGALFVTTDLLTRFSNFSSRFFRFGDFSSLYVRSVSPALCLALCIGQGIVPTQLFFLPFLVGLAYWPTTASNLLIMAFSYARLSGNLPDRLWMDGGFLFVAATYVIVLSHVMVLSQDGCAHELRRTYRGILALPMAKPVPAPESCSGRFLLIGRFIAEDVLSNARRFLSWAEDLPQGIIGVALAVACQQGQSSVFGFAALSAFVSVAKGTLTPAGQSILLEFQLDQLRKHLHMDGFVKSIGPQFPGLSQSPEELKLNICVSLQDYAMSVPTMYMRLRKLEIYETVFETARQWPMQFTDETGGSFSEEAVRELYAGIVSAKRQHAFNLQKVLDEGFAPLACKRGGYRKEQFLECGYYGFEFDEEDFLTAAGRNEISRVAAGRNRGVKLQEALLEGFTPLACKRGGYLEEEFLECAYCRFEFDAGKFLSAEERNKSSRAAKDNRKRGIKLEHVLRQGLLPWACKQGGYRKEDFLECGYSADEFEALRAPVRRSVVEDGF
ncbi:unnamed protein product [Symbiodinium natans]|uniref:Uncharacterized protein n=1 Tax=Symbiodinium natans TaxID=878477 RepID=A0A812SHY9_9DINO|nr:unnamed protein product [Symbiodinium natans]